MKQDTYFIQEAYENICTALITYIKAFNILKSSTDKQNPLDVIDILNKDIRNYDVTIREKIQRNVIDINKKIDDIIVAFDTTARCFSNSTENSFNAFEDLQLLGGGVGLTARTINNAYDARRFVAANKITDAKLNQLANDVIAGKYGFGAERIKKLNSLGYGNIADEVQSRANHKFGVDTGTNTDTNAVTTQRGVQTVNTSVKQTNTTTKAVVTKDGSESKIKDLTARNKELEKNVDIKTKENDKLNKELKIGKNRNDSLNKDLNKERTENTKLNEKLENNNLTIEEQKKTIFAKDSEIEKLREQAKNNSEPKTEPAPEIKIETKPQAQPRTYTETKASQPAATQTPPVEVKPSEQPVVEEVKPATEVSPTTPKQDSGTSLPNPNAGNTNTGSKTKTDSSGSSVVPIAIGLGAAVAGGIGVKAIHDHRKNSKFDDQNEDSITNGNRFWTDEDPNVIHSEENYNLEEDLFNDTSTLEDNTYQAVENNVTNNDTWSIEENELQDDNTFDLLSENN